METSDRTKRMEKSEREKWLKKKVNEKSDWKNDWKKVIEKWCKKVMQTLCFRHLKLETWNHILQCKKTPSSLTKKHTLLLHQEEREKQGTTPKQKNKNTPQKHQPQAWVIAINDAKNDGKKTTKSDAEKVSTGIQKRDSKRWFFVFWVFCLVFIARWSLFPCACVVRVSFCFSLWFVCGCVRFCFLFFVRLLIVFLNLFLSHFVRSLFWNHFSKKKDCKKVIARGDGKKSDWKQWLWKWGKVMLKGLKNEAQQDC